MLTRRAFTGLGLAGVAALAARPGFSLAASPTGVALHGLSVFGDLKYPADFAHFDYVNPDAPKGGRMNFSVPNWAFNQNPQTFDTLNTFILKGNAPPRMELCYDALMVAAADEPSAIYGHLAQTVTISDDRNAYTLTLRPQARFRSGEPVTAGDVAFTYETMKRDGHPSVALPLQRLAKAEALDAATVRLTFDGTQSDAIVITLMALPILRRVDVEAKGFTKTTLEAFDGSGPYRPGRFDVGRYMEYERDPDWWAKDTFLGRGVHNFDTVRIDFFRDRQAAFEAFKKGEIEFREEFVSKTWATEYDFPALADGRVVKTTVPEEKLPDLQGFVCNLRRAKFADPRTRRALGLAFDFEWTNRTLFYGAYAQTDSYFEKSQFEATGMPSPGELALLEPLRDKLAPAVFGEPIAPPLSDGSGRDRRLLREANGLLAQAGWKREGRSLVDASGNPFTIEILMRSPSFERIMAPWAKNLQALGIAAELRLVDPAQYQKRIDTFDFDITGARRSLGATPSREGLQQIFGSSSADVEGSTNLAGLKDEAVDALIDAVGRAKSRADLITAMGALDRVLRSTYAWLPNWHSANHRIAYWDKFGRPEEKPDYAFTPETTWWQDDAKATAVGKG